MHGSANSVSQCNSQAWQEASHNNVIFSHSDEIVSIITGGCCIHTAGGLLSMNFDRQLLAMSQEVQHWERLRMAVPYIAMEIQAQREKYRVLRDNMLMVVRDYNKVIGFAAYSCCHYPATMCQLAVTPGSS